MVDIIAVSILTDDLLNRDSFPSLMPLRTTTQPQSLRTETQVCVGRKASEFKAIRISILLFQFPNHRAFLTTLSNSTDKIRDTHCLRVKVNLPEL